jgi:formylglycine-generating enzyme required for sulfatase activity
MKFGGIFLATAIAVPAVALAIHLSSREPTRSEGADAIVSPRTITVAPGKLTYELPGEFLSAERVVDAPAEEVRFRHPFEIMAYQVSAADYALCVNDGMCEAADTVVSRTGNIPATGVSFRDATAYATWLSERTGESWRLPTDEEWVFAAGERFKEDVLGVENENNPAARWLARYRNEAEAAKGRDPEPKPQGHFGANSNGVYDLAGNVWEWTTTCYRRAALDEAGRIDASTDNCGVRVVGGKHRGYMSFFIRDGKSGGCAAGMPPDNLGIRLVKESSTLFATLKAYWQRVVG